MGWHGLLICIESILEYVSKTARTENSHEALGFKNSRLAGHKVVACCCASVDILLRTFFCAPSVSKYNMSYI
jgi:hypothetical protein